MKNNNSVTNNVNYMLNDIIRSFLNFELWLLLGWVEIKQKYARSKLGQMWITISMAVMVAAIGFVYGMLFKQDIKEYIPIVGCGFFIWWFISGVINDSCFCYINNREIILSGNQPLFIFVLQVFCKNLIIMLHNAIIPLFIISFFLSVNICNVLYFIPGIIIVMLNLLWISQIIAVYSAKYRDVPQIVSSLMQIIFYVTPVLWSSDMISSHLNILHANPFYYFMDITRAPLLGIKPNNSSWIFTIFLSFFGWILMFFTCEKKINKVSSWV